MRLCSLCTFVRFETILSDQESGKLDKSLHNFKKSLDIFSPHHLDQKSYLDYLPSVPSRPIWWFLNLKLAWSLQKLHRLQAVFCLKTLQPFFLDMPLKFKVQ